MQKKKLCAIPIRMRTAPLNTAKWTLEAETIAVAGKEHLIISLFLRSNQRPNYRIFINQDEYITQDFNGQEGRIRTGKIDSITEEYYYWRTDGDILKVLEWFISKAHKMIIEDFCGIQDTYIYDCILKFQTSLHEQKKEAARRRYTDPIDKRMEVVKELPKGFNKWIFEIVLYKSRYIYYQYAKQKEMQGYCTHCKKDVTVIGAKHNESGVCPACKSIITFKAIGKSKRVVDRERATLIQKIPDGFVLRCFDINMNYGTNYRKPVFTLHENKRVFYTNNLIPDSYVWSNFRNVCVRWIYERDEVTGGYSAHYGYATWRDKRAVAALYSRNLKMTLKDTNLRYSEIWTLANCEKNYRFDVEYFINLIKSGDSSCERLIKCGLYNLARDVTNRECNDGLNKKERTLNRMLDLKNDDIKIIRNSNPDSKALNLFKIMRKKGKRLSEENIIEITRQGYSVANLSSIFQYTSPTKALRYLACQKCSECTTLYSDYLDMCKKLNMNIRSSFVLFPQSLKKAHDINVDLINERENEKTYKEHNSKYAAIKKKSKQLNLMFGFQDNNFFIRAPINAEEIVREGQKLHHCVGNGHYSNRMAKGEIAILFLRNQNQPDIPFYTIEVRLKDYSITQYHGLDNLDKNKHLINNFVKKWKKVVLTPLVAEKNTKVG